MLLAGGSCTRPIIRTTTAPVVVSAQAIAPTASAVTASSATSFEHGEPFPDNRVLDGGGGKLPAVALASLAMVDQDGADVLRPGEVVGVVDDCADDLIGVNRKEDVARRFVEVRTDTRPEDEVLDLGHPRVGLPGSPLQLAESVEGGRAELYEFEAHRSVRARTSSRSSSRNDDLNCGGTGSSAWLIKRTSSVTGVGS